MAKKNKKFLSWYSDGINMKETLALILISIFGYSIYIACKKMIGTGLDSLDIELFKILSTHIVIILCFYFGGTSAEKIIQFLFKTKITTNNLQNNDLQNESGVKNENY